MTLANSWSSSTGVAAAALRGKTATSGHTSAGTTRSPSARDYRWPTPSFRLCQRLSRDQYDGNSDDEDRDNCAHSTHTREAVNWIALH